MPPDVYTDQVDYFCGFSFSLSVFKYSSWASFWVSFLISMYVVVTPKLIALDQIALHISSAHSHLDFHKTPKTQSAPNWFQHLTLLVFPYQKNKKPTQFTKHLILTIWVKLTKSKSWVSSLTDSPTNIQLAFKAYWLCLLNLKFC